MPQQRYTTMAEVYDRWMDHDQVPYDQWWSFIHNTFTAEGAGLGCLLDLGCGTGRLLEFAAAAGYRVTGVDASADMLARAERRLPANARLVLSRMQDFDFASTAHVDAVMCCFDALNYVTEDEELRRVFAGVGSALRLGGVFIFDLRSRYALEEYFAQNVTGDVIDDFAFVWRNNYDVTTGHLRADVSFFVLNGNGTYDRTDELHVERTHPHALVEQLLKDNGFELRGRFDRYEDKPLGDETLRETWVALRVVDQTK